MKAFGIVLLAVGAVAAAAGAVGVWWQDVRIRTSQPVPAVVVSTDVEEHRSTNNRGHTSYTYTPVVRYRYETQGSQFEGREVFVLSVNAGRDWAESVVRRFSPGQQVEAWVDPAKPSDVFLLREYSFFPYAFVLLSMVFASIGAGVLLAGGASRANPPQPVAGGGNWYEVRPVRRTADKRRAAFGVFVIWTVVGGFACGHYFLAAGRPYGVTASIAACAYGLLAIIPMAAVVYYHILAGRLGDARLLLNAPRLARGSSVTVGARQTAGTALRVDEATIRLVCEETTKMQQGSKTTYRTANCHDDKVVALTQRAVIAGQRLEYAAQMVVPSDAHPTTPAGEKEYPRYAWSFRLHVALAGSPDYRAQFPVSVE